MSTILSRERLVNIQKTWMKLCITVHADSLALFASCRPRELAYEGLNISIYIVYIYMYLHKLPPGDSAGVTPCVNYIQSKQCL